MSEKIELKDVILEEKYVLEVKCTDCGHVLNSTVVMTGEELSNHWSRLVMSSPLVTGGCPEGCRSTFSDCNINTDMVIRKAKEGDK